MRKTANKIRGNYHVVDFQHIDDLRCFRPLADDFRDAPIRTSGKRKSKQLENKLRSELAEIFKQAGWEGDGKIQCFFVPPCFSVHGRDGDTSCVSIYHVKQKNNGISWLAIPNGFKFRMPEAWLADP